MKDKLLELIRLELKDIPNLTFHDSNYWGDVTPAIFVQRPIKEDYNNPTTYQDYKYIKFTLKFPDGQPDVFVYTDLRKQSETTYVVKKRWYRPDLTARTLTHSCTVYVTCGEFKYELTTEEIEQLFADVNTAFNARTEYRIKARETETIDKINARIARHTNEDDKTT